MNAFKRLFLTLSAGFSSSIDELENHEALASAAIKKVEAAVAKTHVQLSRVTQELGSIDERIADLKREADRWADRAVQVGPLDEPRALECVRRLHSTQKAISRHEHQRQELLTLRLKLAARLEKATLHLNELKQRKALLTARQNEADALQALDTMRSEQGLSLEEVFDRWETRIASREYSAGGSIEELDAFAAEFDKAEEEKEWRSTLEQLLRGVKDDRSEEGKNHE